MNTIEQLETMIATVETKIDDIKNQINEKQKEIDRFEYSCTESEYDEFLDEVEGSVTVAGMQFYASDILKSCDPIAYRCGKIDYESNYDLDNCEEYNDLNNELGSLEYDLEELEDQLSDLESELEDLKYDAHISK